MFGHSFFGAAWYGPSYWGPASGVTPPVVVVTPPAVSSLGGSKARKKIRGPYSDPRIYEEYIARCIAEREAPRQDVAKAVLQEALVDVVTERKAATDVELTTLHAENELLERLVAGETAKRIVKAISARQKQIAEQIKKMEDEEAAMLLAMFDDM